MLMDLGIEKEYIIKVINDLEICTILQVIVKPFPRSQEVTVVVEKWLSSRKAKEIYDGLLLGTPFIIYDGIEKYSHWMAYLAKNPKPLLVDEPLQPPAHSER